MKVRSKLSIVVAVLVLLLCSYDLALGTAAVENSSGVCSSRHHPDDTVGYERSRYFCQAWHRCRSHSLTGSPRLVQTLLAGDVDYALGGVSSVLRARFHGADPVILATTTNYSGQRVLLRPESPLQRLQDLKGKTVGVTQYGSQGDTFFRDALKKNGLKPDADVSIIQMGGIPQVGAALLAGKLDAGVVGESGLLLIQQGRAKPLPGGSAKDLKVPGSGATLNATRRYVARNRDGVMRFLRAYIEGIHYFRTNREGSIRALQKFFAAPPPNRLLFCTMISARFLSPCRSPPTKPFKGNWTAKPILRPRASSRPTSWT